MSALSVEAALVARLRADAGVAARAGDRIRPMTLAEDEILPAIVYQKISDVPDYAMGGQSGLATARVQVAVWADARLGEAAGGYGQAKQLAEAVRLCLSGWRGIVAAGSDSVAIDWVELDNQTDLYDPETGRGIAMFAVISDYMIHYRQDAPRWP
jgi:hypothetical protein